MSSFPWTDTDSTTLFAVPSETPRVYEEGFASFHEGQHRLALGVYGEEGGFNLEIDLNARRRALDALELTVTTGTTLALAALPGGGVVRAGLGTALNSGFSWAFNSARQSFCDNVLRHEVANIVHRAIEIAHNRGEPPRDVLQFIQTQHIIRDLARLSAVEDLSPTEQRHVFWGGLQTVDGMLKQTADVLVFDMNRIYEALNQPRVSLEQFNRLAREMTSQCMSQQREAGEVQNAVGILRERVNILSAQVFGGNHGSAQEAVNSRVEEAINTALNRLRDTNSGHSQQSAQEGLDVAANSLYLVGQLVSLENPETGYQLICASKVAISFGQVFTAVSTGAALGTQLGLFGAAVGATAALVQAFHKPKRDKSLQNLYKGICDQFLKLRSHMDKMHEQSIKWFERLDEQQWKMLKLLEQQGGRVELILAACERAAVVMKEQHELVRDRLDYLIEVRFHEAREDVKRRASGFYSPSARVLTQERYVDYETRFVDLLSRACMTPTFAGTVGELTKEVLLVRLTRLRLLEDSAWKAFNPLASQVQFLAHVFHALNPNDDVVRLDRLPNPAAYAEGVAGFVQLRLTQQEASPTERLTRLGVEAMAEPGLCYERWIRGLQRNTNLAHILGDRIRVALYRLCCVRRDQDPSQFATCVSQVLAEVQLVEAYLVLAFPHSAHDSFLTSSLTFICQHVGHSQFNSKMESELGNLRSELGRRTLHAKIAQENAGRIFGRNDFETVELRRDVLRRWLDGPADLLAANRALRWVLANTQFPNRPGLWNLPRVLVGREEPGPCPVPSRKEMRFLLAQAIQRYQDRDWEQHQLTVGRWVLFNRTIPREFRDTPEMVVRQEFPMTNTSRILLSMFVNMLAEFDDFGRDSIDIDAEDRFMFEMRENIPHVVDEADLMPFASWNTPWRINWPDYGINANISVGF